MLEKKGYKKKDTKIKKQQVIVQNFLVRVLNLLLGSLKSFFLYTVDVLLFFFNKNTNG